MEFNALIIVAWLPICIVFLKDIFWNLYIWENKEYRFDRFLTYLRWDFEPANSKTNLNVLKIIAFCLLSLYLVSPLLAVTGTFIAYFAWSAEVFEFIGTIVKNRFKSANFFNLRNFVIFILIFSSLIILISVISFPFSIIDRTHITSSTNNINAFPQLVKTGDTYFPDVYIFLILSFIFGLFIDLASPIILSIFVLVTSPLTFAINRLKILKLKNLLSKNADRIIIIVIMGNKERSKIRDLITDIAKEKYNTLTSIYSYSSIANIANNINNKISDKTQIIVLDIDGYKPGEIDSITKILKPDIVVLSDINISNLGLFGSIKKYITSRFEVLRNIKKEGVLIFNNDNKYCVEASKIFKGEKIGFGSKSIKNNDINTLKFIRNKNNYGVSYNKLIKPIEITGLNNNNKLTILSVIAVVKELGLTDHFLKTYFKNADSLYHFNSIQGDQNSLILHRNNDEGDYKALIDEVNYALSLKKIGDYKKIILINDGFKSHGKFKKMIYIKLINNIKDKIDTLITSDFVINKIALEDNISLNVIFSKDIDKVIYEARKNMSNRDIFIIEGKNSSEIIESLRSETN